MSYIVKKALETYYETLILHSIKEQDIRKFSASGNVVQIETPTKTYMKTIKR